MRCPSCGHENSEGTRFCGECATPLTLAHNRPAGERKVVTVLFCDMVGFTAASEQADPEDVQARIDPYFDRLTAAVVAYGGTLEKYIGDAVQAVFGAPMAHEDDPERAVRAALRILDEISDLNRADPTLDLTVRIGVNTGEVLVHVGPHDETRGLLTGDVVNTASRLQGLAPEGGIVVSESTYRATERVFDYQALGPVTVKGKAEPLSIWRVVASRARLGTDITRSFAGPLVGRDPEVRLLRDMFERTVRDRSVELATVVGEPGIGKSRLVAELASLLEAWPDLIRWRQGRCLPYGEGVTFWALGEIVKAEVGILETDASDVTGAKIDAAVRDDPDAAWLRQRVRPLVGLDAPQAAREENFTAWRRFLESLAESGPCVLVFEDLHWADEALLAFIENVLEHAAGVPMLMVATARPELFDRFPTWAAAARNATRINLPPLSDPDTARLIGNLLQTAALPAGVQAALLSRSGGNPLYAGEFVHLLKDRGILTREGSTWTLGPNTDIPVPSEVRALIAARLDALGPSEKGIAEDAAVIGEVFWAGAVADMGSLDPDAVTKALHELTHTELIRPARRSSMEGQSEYTFSHGLIRDVCYGLIPKTSRAERHQRAAGWIERVSGERVEDHADILAAHYTTALDLARAAHGQDTSELEDKALRYLVLAGDRAMGIDVEAAERHYARALLLTEKGHPERPRVLARTGEALRLRGRFPEAALAYEEAIEGLRAQGDVRAMGVAMGHHRMVRLRLGDPRSKEVGAQAVAALEPLGPSSELAQALTELAGQCFQLSEFREAIVFADRAIVLAKELGLPEQARALGFRGAALAWLGDADGVQVMRRALDVAAEQGRSRDVALLYNNIDVALWPIEGSVAWLEAAREGAAFAEQRGFEDLALTFASSTVLALIDLGSYEEALALAADLVPRLEAANDVWELVQVRSAQVRVITRVGNHAEGTRLADWVVEKARDSAHAPLLAQAFPAAAALRLAVGETARALALLDELERTLYVRTESNHAANLPSAVRTALAAEDPDLARRLVESLDPIYPLHQHALATASALLREHQGSYAEAAELFADCAVRWEGFEVPWERAQALLGQGRCLLALGRLSQAAAPLSEASELFVAVGAKPAIAETDDMLARTTALTS